MSALPRKAPHSKRYLRQAGVVAVAVITAIGLAACSSTPSPAKTSSSTTTASITVLRSTGSTFEPLFIAQTQGFFKKQHLNVTIKEGAQDTSANVPSVVNGEAQFAMTDSGGFITGTGAGLPVQAVVQLQASDPSTPATDGLILAKGITSASQLNGKTIGIAALGGTLQMAADFELKKYGADPTQVKFAALPLTSMQQSLASGQIQGMYTFTPFFDMAKAAGFQVIGKGTNDIPGLSQALFFASKSWLASNGPIAKRFVAAITEAENYANANPAAVRAVDTKYTTLPAATIANRIIAPFSPTFTKSAMTTGITTMVKYKLIPKAPVGDLYWSGAPTK